MNHDIDAVQDFFNDKKIEIKNKKVEKLIKKSDFYVVLGSITEIGNIINNQNVKQSRVIMISQYKDANFHLFVFVFDKTILVLNISDISSTLKTLYDINPTLKFCFITEIIEKNENNNDFLKKCKIDIDDIFNLEINNFVQSLNLSNLTDNSLIKSIWKEIRHCFAGYLIKQSYLKKANLNRINDFFENKEIDAIDENIQENDYIFLRRIGNGSSFIVNLIYLIKKEELCILKRPFNGDLEQKKLIEREFDNYKKLRHPFVPKLIGKTMNYIIIEYIYGDTLDHIKTMNLSDCEKMKILFELMFVISFIHYRNFIYRDLKPNNIMIDQNKTVVLIDFDRMVYYDTEFDQVFHTNSFSSVFVAPEINKGDFSFECDIYSLGQMIYYIITENIPKENNLIELTDFGKYTELYEVYFICTKNKFIERPTIMTLFLILREKINLKFKNLFFSIENNENLMMMIVSEIQNIKNSKNPYSLVALGIFHLNNYNELSNIQNAKECFLLAAENEYPEALFYLFYIFNDGSNTFIKAEAIEYLEKSANKNYSLSQLAMGILYVTNNDIRDIGKAIHYLCCSAEQQNSDARFYLGALFYDGIYVKADYIKALEYFQLSADQNNSAALLFLSELYSDDKIFRQDLNKSHLYLLKASEHNDSMAQLKLGLLYYNGNKYIKCDINRSLHYLELSANQNNSEAQLRLGLIFYSSQKIRSDINKAIRYLTLSANQNNSNAQFFLGLIYYLGRNIKSDIRKSIYYLQLSSSQNNSDAHSLLGKIYLNGQGVECNIDKAFNYFLLAANQNLSEAQYHLGQIYLINGYAKFDVNKALHYLYLSANQNDSNAQFLLGRIFYEGKYVNQDINKSIHFLYLSANQDNSLAQYLLGKIYLYDKSNIEKAIFYLSISSNKNNQDAQFLLGIIYIIKLENITKGIHYLTIAANQNHSDAQLYLGILYTTRYIMPHFRDFRQYLIQSKYILKYFEPKSCINDQNFEKHVLNNYLIMQKVTPNITKGIHYLTLAANQNHSIALICLSILYSISYNVPKDIYKSIYYLTRCNDFKPLVHALIGILYLFTNPNSPNIEKSIEHLKISSNQNFALSQCLIGYMLYYGIYMKRDIQKSIMCLTMAANENFSFAQYFLAEIYYKGKYIPKNIKKSMIYYHLAAESCNIDAQYKLGLFYLDGENVNQDIEKGMNLVLKSLQNGKQNANYTLGCLYQEGKYIEKDIIKAVHYLKEASSLNYSFAKNNLGVIYKNGFGNEISKRLSYAIELFKESIKKNNNILPKYNLAHLYIYENMKQNIDESIDLLIKTYKQGFTEALEFLCISLMKKHGMDLEKVMNEIEFENPQRYEEISEIIIHNIIDQQLNDKNVFDKMYELYRQIDFLYDHNYGIYQNGKLPKFQPKQKSEKSFIAKNINSLFYDGFGLDLEN